MNRHVNNPFTSVTNSQNLLLNYTLGEKNDWESVALGMEVQDVPTS
jgi:hypothetical protein